MKALLRVLGRPVLVPSLALAVAVGLPATILSAGNGLRAHDVTRLMHESLAVRALLWIGWLVLVHPALRALFVAPGSRLLRSLNLPRLPLFSALFLLSALPELPWVTLFARGAGLVSGWATLLLAVSLSCSLLAAPQQRMVRLCWALGAALVVLEPAPWFLSCAAAALVPYSLAAAWRGASEERLLQDRLTRPRTALRALYSVHLLRLLRAERPRLSCVLAASAIGTLGLILSLTRDPPAQAGKRALLIMALPLAVSAALCAVPILRNEQHLRAALRSLGVRRSVVLGAFFCAVATPSSALAASSGALSAALCAPHEPYLIGLLLAWAIGLSSAVGIWARVQQRRASSPAGTFVAGVALIALLAIVGVDSW